MPSLLLLFTVDMMNDNRFSISALNLQWRSHTLNMMLHYLMTFLIQCTMARIFVKTEYQLSQTLFVCSGVPQGRL